MIYVTVWFNARNQKKEYDAKNGQQITMYWLERHYLETHAAPLVIIFDMSQTGLQNMVTITFIISTID